MGAILLQFLIRDLWNKGKFEYTINPWAAKRSWQSYYLYSKNYTGKPSGLHIIQGSLSNDDEDEDDVEDDA